MSQRPPPFRNPPRMGGVCASLRHSAFRNREGSALIVALWVLLLLSLLVGSFAYDMHIEGGITSYYRKRVKAQHLARGGVEWAKMVLAKSYEVSEETKIDEADEQLYVSALNLSRGVGIRGHSHPLGAGQFVVDILPEQGRLNVNLLTREEWEELLDQSNVPQEEWDALIDCFTDWIDENDLHQLNGAESDDEFYQERGYEVKNAPLDLVDELLLIKGFERSIVYGGPPEDGEEDEEAYLGIADQLTTWGDGKVNINTADRRTLLALPGIDEFVVDDIMERRLGLDQEPGTEDDGFETIDEVMAETGLDSSLRGRISINARSYVRVVSIGEVQGVRNAIWCILLSDENGITPVFWREENLL